MGMNHHFRILEQWFNGAVGWKRALHNSERMRSEKWIHVTRRWTMVTWGISHLRNFSRAHWAYSVLGWGGYWGWDPVEKCIVDAMAHRHRLLAFSDDAGKTAAC